MKKKHATINVDILQSFKERIGNAQETKDNTGLKQNKIIAPCNNQIIYPNMLIF